MFGGVTLEITEARPIIPLSRDLQQKPVTPELSEEEKQKLEEEKQKAAEVKARRAAALSLLLEPPSPGTFSSLSDHGGDSAVASNAGVRMRICVLVHVRVRVRVLYAQITYVYIYR